MDHHRDRYLIDLLLRRFGHLETALISNIKIDQKYDITRQQVMFFSYLSDKCCQASDLAKEMKISRQAVHQIVVELEEKGYIKREVNPDQNNAKIITKTEKGKALNSAAREQLEKTERIISRNIGKDNMDILREILTQDWGNIT